VLSRFTENMSKVEVPQAQRGIKDRGGTTLIYLLVYLLRDITGRDFEYEKRDGPSEFIRIAFKKVFELQDVTIDNKLKMVLRSLR
jgi:hypothetical protein